MTLPAQRRGLPTLRAREEAPHQGRVVPWLSAHPLHAQRRQIHHHSLQHHYRSPFARAEASLLILLQWCARSRPPFARAEAPLESFHASAIRAPTLRTRRGAINTSLDAGFINPPFARAKRRLVVASHGSKHSTAFHRASRQSFHRASRQSLSCANHFGVLIEWDRYCDFRVRQQKSLYLI